MLFERKLNMVSVEFKEEFERRFASNEWDNLRLGGKNCPKRNSYALYKVCFIQTLYEMRRLGHSIPKSYKMPKHDIAQADKIIKSMAKTWKLVI